MTKRGSTAIYSARRARWTAALVLAPSAAAVFGATVSWAGQTRPTTAAPPPAVPAVTPVPTPAGASADPVATERLNRELAAKRVERAQLAAQLAAVRTHLTQFKAAEKRARARAAASGKQNDVPVAGGGNPAASAQGGQGGQGQAPQGTSFQPAPVQAAPVQAAPVQAAPVQAAPPPPPPVQATTGASGAPK